ncbi:UDP-N-acetylmuramoyl-L-alanyl-D-glutamate--2,6-diaminopimelate ligase [Patescibacteria group bacterium]|nr:UDP-N-acetylmuramoyl-L-alanyl-D-glutamate--2,6-diaminopimelate ligase [Patescibacteria group bacterium]
MKLLDILENIEYKQVIGSTAINIASFSQDSRDENLADGLYVAVPGTQVDGHDFISDAINKGAVAVVCERLPELATESDVIFVVVEDARKALGTIASNFYQNPTKELTVIAVTGTNGKTSVVHYFGQVLCKLGHKPLVLSTAGDSFAGTVIDIDRKAPSSLEVIELNRVARKYLDQGATHLLIEATSQALDQHRLSGVDINAGIFTNLDQDHLDYHKTFEHYAESKKLLFDGLESTALAISNFDDDYGAYMLADTPAQKISYGSDSMYNYSFNVTATDLGSIEVEFNQSTVVLPVIGGFNVYNALAVYAALVELGFEEKNIFHGLEGLTGVPGRMEQILNNHNVLAVVDYAHSPGALVSVLETLRALPHERIITVIGCGGDRDRTKRAPMTEVTQRLSDYVIYTADNPRTEDLDQIFSDMRNGIDSTRENFTFIHSREEAIAEAVNQSQPNDIILVAGKGHEDYQIIGTEKHHFNDREQLDNYLNLKTL